MREKIWNTPKPLDTARYAPADVFEAGMRNHHISNTAYPIAHKKTWWPYRVARAETDEVTVDAWRGIEHMSLYAHIPFCEVRCSFCEYTVVSRDDLQRVDAYMTDLLTELSMVRERIGAKGRTLHGFDIGGGTPSFVSGAWIARLVHEVKETFRFDPASDISIETTPKIAAADLDKLVAYRRAGIDRISMGIQVIQPDLLRVLNRASNGVEHHFRAVDNIRAAGFERLNVDLMFGFARQSLDSWRATLKHAIDLGPEYITLYRMRYKLTRISHQSGRVNMDTVRPMILLAKQMLRDAGYDATPGKTTYSKISGDVGTSSYLARRVIDGLPYLGIGLGAQTFTDTTIAYKDGAVGKNLAPYHKSIQAARLPIQDLYALPRCHMMAKMCCVSFYFGGIDLAAFEAKFGVRLADAYPDAIAFLTEEGLMEYADGALRMTPKGALHKPGVIAQFHAPSVQGYLLARDPEKAEDMNINRRLANRVAS